jgi:hypothetical protein
LNYATLEISVVDADTLQIVKFVRGLHEDDVSYAVIPTSPAQAYTTKDGSFSTEADRAICDKGGIWTAGKDGKAVNWDERSGK